LLISLVKEMVALGDAMLPICWENITETIYSSGDDRAIFVVYNPVKNQFVSIVRGALRSEREVLLQLPEKFAGDGVHVYMFYSSEQSDRVSTSLYLGELRIN
jgi:hypothetical protein